MDQLGSFAGRKTVAAAWSVAVAIATLVWVVATGPDIVGSVTTIGAIAGVVWFLGLAALRHKAKRHWLHTAEVGEFSPQANERGTYPALQATIRGRTVTAVASAPGFFAEDHTILKTAVSNVERSVSIQGRHVGGGVERRGPTVSNPALDESFIFAGSTLALLPEILSPEVQSAMMDLEVPGTLSVRDGAVTYEVPFTRLSAAQLRRCARVVATIAVEMEGGRTWRGGSSSHERSAQASLSTGSNGR
jgi:hypothetical protein